MGTQAVSVIGFGDNVVDKYEHIKTMYPGGNAVNFAAYAKKIGVQRSAYMGIFGNDAEAEYVIYCLGKEKIETVKCRQIIGENGCARATVIDNDRVFLGSNEGGVRGEVRYALDRFDLEYISQFDLLHSGNYCFTERELYKIKKAGVPISFDFSDDSTEEYYKAIAPFVDFAFMSCSEMSEQDIIDRLNNVFACGPTFVLASRGAQGCIAFDGNRYYMQAALPVKNMVDTMGAGDALITAFMVAYIARSKAKGAVEEADVSECLYTAADFASLACGFEGAWGYPKKYEK